MRDRSEQWKAWEARNTALVERIHAARTDELRTTPDLAAERDALQARLDEAEGLLRESTRWTRHDHGCPASYSNVCSCGLDNHRTARFNFSTLENGGA